MVNIAIVTDTSSDILPEHAKADGIRLVPLTVSFDDETWEAGTGLSNEDFYQKLTAPGAPFPRTAAPNPAAFEAAFREALDAGADGIVCVTLSEKASATYSSAVNAAASFDEGKVEVVDSKTSSHSLALMVRGAVRLATTGATQDEIVAHVEDLRSRSQLFFTVSTLEYLQKGGRIGRASALLGTALSIRPVLYIDDGVVATADKRRTAAKARARLLELVSERPVEQVVVLQTMTPGIEEFADDVAVAMGLDREAIELGVMGPVSGSHLGPGVLGAAFITTD
jgi:DegV family protein with EDD domain